MPDTGLDSLLTFRIQRPDGKMLCLTAKRREVLAQSAGPPATVSGDVGGNRLSQVASALLPKSAAYAASLCPRAGRLKAFRSVQPMRC